MFKKLQLLGTTVLLDHTGGFRSPNCIKRAKLLEDLESEARIHGCKTLTKIFVPICLYKWHNHCTWTNCMAMVSVRNNGGSDPLKSMRDPCKVVICRDLLISDPPKSTSLFRTLAMVWQFASHYSYFLLHSVNVILIIFIQFTRIFSHQCKFITPRYYTLFFAPRSKLTFPNPSTTDHALSIGLPPRTPDCLTGLLQFSPLYFSSVGLGVSH